MELEFLAVELGQFLKRGVRFGKVVAGQNVEAVPHGLAHTQFRVDALGFHFLVEPRAIRQQQITRPCLYERRREVFRLVRKDW